MTMHKIKAVLTATALAISMACAFSDPAQAFGGRFGGVRGGFGGMHSFGGFGGMHPGFAGRGFAFNPGIAGRGFAFNPGFAGRGFAFNRGFAGRRFAFHRFHRGRFFFPGAVYGAAYPYYDYDYSAYNNCLQWWPGYGWVNACNSYGYGYGY